MTAPAPPTECVACEAERDQRRDPDTGKVLSVFMRPQVLNELHHALLAEKDARIRELVATVQSAIRIYRQVESERRPNGKGLSPFFFGQRLRRLIREWVELSEAALARSEGEGK